MPQRIASDEADLEALWAKSSELGGLPLIRHLLDVSAVAMQVLQRLPARQRARLFSSVGLDDQAGLRWVALLVGLHDLGKATPGFQAKWPEGRERVARAGYPFPVGVPDRHDAATLALLPTLLRSCIQGLDRGTAVLLADAVAAHHGQRIASTDAAAFSPLDAPAPDPWPKVQDRLVRVMLEVLAPQGVPRVSQADRPGVWQMLAGLCSFSDWLGSSEFFFPHDRASLPLDDWFVASQRLARNALDRIGWSELSVSSPASDRLAQPDPLKAALPPGANPRPLQRAVAQLLADATDPHLVLIEAPMGEGKTEAAFAAFAALADAADHRGLYVAMPTQATSNALYGRVAAFLGRLHRQDDETLQLVHGGATVEDARLRLRDVGFGPDDASVHASAWFAGSKKALLAANAVGTVDQALIAVLNARHSFVRMFGLAGRFVVLDEVHAYDDYTGGLLEHLVGWLATLGCSVVVMSATLPSAKRSSLARAWRTDVQLPALEYPRICVVGSDRVEGAVFPAARSQQVRVLSGPEHVDEIAKLAASLVLTGGCALVVANTVRRAQQIFEALGGNPDVERLLFHAQYPFEERLAREREVIRRFGVAGQGRDRVILVATQVVEQSLDIDFDVGISDLAPVDLLFQRIGRLHRHLRDRPPHVRQPTLYVAGLGDVGVPPHGPRRIYEDWPVLRTAACLRVHRTLEFPLDIDRLVQKVYGDDATITSDSELDRAVRETALTHAQVRARQAELATQAALPMPEDWIGWTQARPIEDAAAETAGPAGGTRLGLPSVQIVPIYDLADRWGVDPQGALSWMKADPIPEWACRRLADRYLRLARHLVMSVSMGRPPPRGWVSSPLTEPFVPVVFDSSGVATGDAVRLLIDADLGLRIERHPS